MKYLGWKKPASSPEGGVIRTYLDWIVDLPWSKETKDTEDIKNVKGSFRKRALWS